jgi:hypothetical protein
MTIKYLSNEQELRHVIELENLKDKWLEKLDACALDGEKTLDDVLLMLLDGVKAISTEGLVLSMKKQPLHVQLYEVRPLNSTSIRTLRAIKAHNHSGEFDYDLDMMLYLKFDTSMGLDNAVSDIVDEQRYLPIINGTVTGDVYMGEMPVVCVDRPLEIPDSEIVGNVHYGVYNEGRMSKSNSRAAFPVINRRTKEVEYVVVIDKKGSLLSQHEIRYVRNLLARSHEVIVIKDLENRAHLHDAYMKRRLHDLNNLIQMIEANIGLGLDRVPTDSSENSKRLRMALMDAKNNFDILTEHLRSSSEGHNYYDMRAHHIGSLISAKLKSYERYDFYKGHLKFNCRFDSGDRMALIDKNAFNLALDNMTKNTFEALKKSDGSIDEGKIAEVSIDACVNEGNIIILYFDNCGGMDPMLYESVMRRGACKTTKKDGSGFGVASILSTFRDMGYVIDPKNEPGLGFGYEITMKVEEDFEKHVFMDITTGETVGN